MSAYFDPKDKKNKPIIDYFANKTWLIIENSSSARLSIKKTISQLGPQIQDMLDADNIADAEFLIQEKKPNFVITNKTLKGDSALSLFKFHMDKVPNRNECGFFVITEEINVSEVGWNLEYEMEGIIPLPLNGAMVIQAILAGIKKKINPSPYLKKIEEGRALYLSENHDQAQKVFQSALSLDEHPAEGHCFLGQIYHDKKHTKEAIASFEESVKHNATYFKPLNQLSMLYLEEKNFKKSYEMNQILSQHFPVPPERIPELIRLSILNHKYEDVINYYKLFQTIPSPTLEMQNYISAGMATLGKYFASINDVERAEEALKDAYKFSNGKYEILKSITQSFEEIKKAEVLYDLFGKTDLDKWPKEVHGLYYHTLNLHCKDDQRVITEGEKLLKNNIKHPLIYRGIIERSIKMKRKASYIEDIVSQAQKSFPNLASEFASLLS